MNSLVSVEDGSSECCTDELIFSAANISGSCTGEESNGSDFDNTMEVPSKNTVCMSAAEVNAVNMVDEDILFIVSDVDKRSVDFGTPTMLPFTIKVEGIGSSDDEHTCSDESIHFDLNNDVVEDLFDANTKLSEIIQDFDGFSDASGSSFDGFDGFDVIYETNWEDEPKCKINSPLDSLCTNKRKRGVCIPENINLKRLKTLRQINSIDNCSKRASLRSAHTHTLEMDKKPSGFLSGQFLGNADDSSDDDMFEGFKENCEIKVELRCKTSFMNTRNSCRKYSEVVKIEPKDSIGEFCNKVGCSINWLETGEAMGEPVEVKNGIVFELHEFAKKIAWEPEWVIKWIMRLRGYIDVKPSEEDLEKVHLLLRRRKAISITFAGKNSCKQKLLSFDAGGFSLPSSEKLDNESLFNQDLLNDIKKDVGNGETTKISSENDSEALKDIRTEPYINDLETSKDYTTESIISKSQTLQNSNYQGILPEQISNIMDKQELVLRKLNTPKKSNLSPKVIHKLFSVGKNFIGDHCHGNKIDIKLLNSNMKMTCPAITNGIVYELYYFYKEQGATLTSLVHTLYRLIGLPVDKAQIVSTMAKLHELVKVLWNESVEKNQDLPYDEFVLNFNNIGKEPGIYQSLPYEEGRDNKLNTVDKNSFLNNGNRSSYGEKNSDLCTRKSNLPLKQSIEELELEKNYNRVSNKVIEEFGELDSSKKPNLDKIYRTAVNDCIEEKNEMVCKETLFITNISPIMIKEMHKNILFEESVSSDEEVDNVDAVHIQNDTNALSSDDDEERCYTKPEDNLSNVSLSLALSPDQSMVNDVDLEQSPDQLDQQTSEKCSTINLIHDYADINNKLRCKRKADQRVKVNEEKDSSKSIIDTKDGSDAELDIEDDSDAELDIEDDSDAELDIEDDSEAELDRKEKSDESDKKEDSGTEAAKTDNSVDKSNKIEKSKDKYGKKYEKPEMDEKGDELETEKQGDKRGCRGTETVKEKEIKIKSVENTNTEVESVEKEGSMPEVGETVDSELEKGNKLKVGENGDTQIEAEGKVDTELEMEKVADKLENNYDENVGIEGSSKSQKPIVQMKSKLQNKEEIMTNRQGKEKIVEESWKEDSLTNSKKFDLNSTKGHCGIITRGDIVYLYTRWLKKKMDGDAEVFVSDLSQDVDKLKIERKVENIRIPVGTLMSSSVKLFDEFRILAKSSMADARTYLIEDWMEDMKYLLKSKLSRRNTIDSNDSNSIDHISIPNEQVFQSQVKDSDPNININKVLASSLHYGNISNNIDQEVLPNSLSIAPSPIKETSAKSLIPNSRECETRTSTDKVDGSVIIKRNRGRPKKIPSTKKKVILFKASHIEKIINKSSIHEEPSIEKIVGYRIVKVGKDTATKYKVRWVGRSSSDDSWMDEENLHCPDTLSEFWRVLEEQKKRRQESVQPEAKQGPLLPKAKQKPLLLKAKQESVIQAVPQVVKESSGEFHDLFVESLNPDLVNYQLDQDKDLVRRSKVTRAEVLAIYDEWRQGNKESLMASELKTINGQTSTAHELKTINVQTLIDAVKSLMDCKRVRNFNSNCIMDTCYRMTLMRKKLKDCESIKSYLEGDFLELMEASNKHQSCLREENRMKLGKRKSSVLTDQEAKPNKVANKIEEIENIELEVMLMGSILNKFKDETVLKDKIGIYFREMRSTRKFKKDGNAAVNEIISMGVSEDCLNNIVEIVNSTL